jgi:hypothetical protein
MNAKKIIPTLNANNYGGINEKIYISNRAPYDRSKI